MGVKGLYTFVSSSSCYSTVDLGEEAQRAKQNGKPFFLVVDGSGLIFQLTYKKELDSSNGGEYLEFRESVISFVNSFRRFGIEIHVFLDGSYEQLKKTEVIKRRCSDCNDVYAVWECTKRNVKNVISKPPYAVKEEFIDALKSLNVQITQCLEEADYEIGKFSRENCDSVFAVLGQDSDFYLFDMSSVHYIPFDCLFFSDDHLFAESYHSTTIAKVIGVKREHLGLFSCIAGNDYTSYNIAHLLQSNIGIRKGPPEFFFREIAHWINDQNWSTSRPLQKLSTDQRVLNLIKKASNKYHFPSGAQSSSSSEKQTLPEKTENTITEMSKLSIDGKTEAKSCDTPSLSSNPSITPSLVHSRNCQLLLPYLQNLQFDIILFTIFQNREFWSRVVIQDFEDENTPLLVTSGIRKRIYGIIFIDEINVMQKGDIRVLEYFQSKVNYKLQHQNIELKDSFGESLLGINSLYNNPSQRAPTICKVLGIDHLFNDISNESHRILCLSLFYVLSWHFPLLFEWEFNAILTMLLFLEERDKIKHSSTVNENIESFIKKDTPNLTVRCVQVSTLLQVTLHHIFLLNQVCFNPLPSFPPSTFFDGNIWGKIYPLASDLEKKRLESQSKDINNDKKDNDAIQKPSILLSVFGAEEGGWINSFDFLKSSVVSKCDPITCFKQLPKKVPKKKKNPSKKGKKSQQQQKPPIKVETETKTAYNGKYDALTEKLC